MNYLTACNGRYFHTLLPLAQSCVKYNGIQIIVYDLGLTDDQKEQLDGYAVIVSRDITPGWDGMATFDKGSAITTTHKPEIIKDYFSTCKTPILYVDADCLFRESVKQIKIGKLVAYCDMAVTMRYPEDVDVSDKYTGLINAGVMYFKNWNRLLDKWVVKCKEPNTTDQKAMNEVLELGEGKFAPGATILNVDQMYYTKQGEDSITVEILKCSEYNDYKLDKGKIFHFKSDNHRHYKYAELLEGMGGV